MVSRVWRLEQGLVNRRKLLAAAGLAAAAAVCGTTLAGAAAGAILIALSNEAETYNVIQIASQTDVTVQGGTTVGERNEHAGTTGE